MLLIPKISKIISNIKIKQTPKVNMAKTTKLPFTETFNKPIDPDLINLSADLAENFSEEENEFKINLIA